VSGGADRAHARRRAPARLLALARTGDADEDADLEQPRERHFARGGPSPGLDTVWSFAGSVWLRDY